MLREIEKETLTDGMYVSTPFAYVGATMKPVFAVPPDAVGSVSMIGAQ